MIDTIIKGLFDLAGIALSLALGYLIAQRKDAKKADDSVMAGVRILLYDRIKHLGKKYVSRGNITLEEMEDLHTMHKIYHEELAGNGFLDSLMKTVDSLPKTSNQRESVN